jgi:hypothetical protein
MSHASLLTTADEVIGLDGVGSARHLGCRFGFKGDIAACPNDVRLTPKADITEP